MAALAHPAAANSSPAMPTIWEPASDGLVLNAADVHMATAPFSDPDPQDTHVCSDWEIWTTSPSQRVWSALCASGASAVHIHLGDGGFEGSHAGRQDLQFSTNYLLKVRQRDSSGVPATEWSAYAQRPFSTAAASTAFPLQLDDILESPQPIWIQSNGAVVVLPGGTTPGVLRLEAPDGALLLELRGIDGTANQMINPPHLVDHAFVRVRATAGGAALALDESTLRLFTDEGDEFTLYLPALALNAGEDALFWAAADGSTYLAAISETEPLLRWIARRSALPWIVSQRGYRVSIAASGFQLPVNIAFVPNPGPAGSDPLYYVAELYGQIKMVTREGAVSDYATNLLNYNPTGEFPGSGEQGLAGIAVNPANGDLYCSLVYDAGGLHYPKVVRFTSTDGGRTAATQTTIRDMVGEDQGPSHQISNVTIGPDGKLYVHVGDGFITSTAVNLNSYRGKILRMNLDGTAPSDNPFYTTINGITATDYVFAYGFRNPFGGAWRTSDAAHYEVENGPSRDRFAKVVAARNYGWNGTDASMSNFALYNWNPSTAPVNVAFVQTSVFGGSGFPAGKMDHAFVSESGSTWASGVQTLGKRITEFVIDAAGSLVSGPTQLLQYGGAGKASVAALAAGPDGLYFSDLYKDQDYQSPIDRGANILRVRFVGTVGFRADVTSGQAPVAVHFTDLSNVPSPTGRHWDFGDGATSSAQQPTHVYTQGGVYDVQLEVNSAGGIGVHHKRELISVLPAAPGDLDVDGDVDLDDYTVFAACLSGPLLRLASDFDEDGSVGSQDFAALALCLDGPGSAASPACNGEDVNGDGRVDLEDFGRFQLDFGAQPPGLSPDCTAADIDSSGAVDLRDFAALQRLLGAAQ